MTFFGPLHEGSLSSGHYGLSFPPTYVCQGSYVQAIIKQRFEDKNKPKKKKYGMIWKGAGVVAFALKTWCFGREDLRIFQIV